MGYVRAMAGGEGTKVTVGGAEGILAKTLFAPEDPDWLEEDE